MSKNTIYRLDSDPDKFAWLKIESKNWQEYSRQILGPKTKPVARSWVAPGGNCFAIDTANSKQSPVYEFDHEEYVWNRPAKSLQEFADELIKLAEKVRKSDKKKR